MTTIATTADAVRAVLEQECATPVEAAFVYGSVAAGTASEDSDLDTFVITTEPVGEDERNRVRTAFHELQLHLGHRPDPKHPVEVFSVLQCADALTEVLVFRALTTAADGDDLDPMTLDSDCLEVLRALLCKRLSVIDSLVLDSLTTMARIRVENAATRHGVSPGYIAARIRLTHPALPWSHSGRLQP